MADLTSSEKRKLERLFGMGIDYVRGLAAKLDELGIVDPVVRELQAVLRMNG
jgi:hypothetical protein